MRSVVMGIIVVTLAILIIILFLSDAAELR
jgi:hypothetical protein